MAIPIFKIAKDGQSAVTTNQKDLVFDIENDYMVILEERIDNSGSNKRVEITHGLGYIPTFYHFHEETPGVWKRPPESGLGGVAGIGGAYADNNKIYIHTPNANQRVRTVIWGNAQDNSGGGNRNNATGRFKVAKAGYDAEVETDLRRFKFASGGGVFKIKEKRKLTVTVHLDTNGDSDDTVQYAHNLGYVPHVYVLLKSGNSGVQIPSNHFMGAGVAVEYDYSITSTDLRVHVRSYGYALNNGEKIDFIAQILLDKVN